MEVESVIRMLKIVDIYIHKLTLSIEILLLEIAKVLRFHYEKSATQIYYITQK
jgi:hypothetical protein